HYPLLDIPQIRARQDAVAELVEKSELLHGLQEGLGKLQDVERMLGKLSLGTVHARDLSGLARSLQEAQGLIAGHRGTFQSKFLQDLIADYPDMKGLCETVLAQLQAELPITVREGGMIAPGVHPELDELRAISRDGKSFIAAMEE